MKTIKAIQSSLSRSSWYLRVALALIGIALSFMSSASMSNAAMSSASMSSEAISSVALSNAANQQCLTSAQLEQNRPNPLQGPTSVLTSLYILDVISLSDQEQEFVADVVIELSWQDSRLATDKNKCRYDLNAIWHPSVQIFNQRSIATYLPNQVEVDSKGKVTFLQRYYGSFGSPLKLREFPFDQQTLSFDLVSFYTASEVQLVFNQELTGRDENPSIVGWSLGKSATSFDAYTTESRYSDSKTESFSRIKYGVIAERNINYYRWKVLLPLALIVILSWAVFWIDPSEFAAQMGSAATAMLTLIAFLFSLRGILPPISELTRLDYFVYGSLGLVFLTSIEALVTANLARRQQIILAKRIDRYLSIIFPLCFMVFVSYFWF